MGKKFKMAFAVRLEQGAIGAVRELTGKVSPQPPGEDHDWCVWPVQSLGDVLKELPDQLGLGTTKHGEKTCVRDEFLVVFPPLGHLSEERLAEIRLEIMTEIQRLLPGWAGKLTVTVLG